MKDLEIFLLLFGSLLIYDNHPQILEEYNINNCIPIYDYRKFNAYFGIIERLRQKDYKGLLRIKKKEFKNFL